MVENAPYLAGSYSGAIRLECMKSLSHRMDGLFQLLLPFF